jgi:hypothetical protein
MVLIDRFVRKEKRPARSVERTDPTGIRVWALELCPASVTKEFDVESRTETEAFSFTDLDKPWGAGGERFHIDALGHKKDPVQGDRWKAG